MTSPEKSQNSKGTKRNKYLHFLKSEWAILLYFVLPLLSIALHTQAKNGIISPDFWELVVDLSAKARHLER